MIEATTLATAWLQALAARGISVTLRNGRLVYSPGGYKQLTDAEVIFARHNRAAIREALLAGLPSEVSATPAGCAAVPTLAPAPKKCPYCNRAPCVGESHELFYTLHPDAEPPRYSLVDLLQHSRGLPAWRWD